mgnify:CR=1 FL=1
MHHKGGRIKKNPSLQKGHKIVMKDFHYMREEESIESDLSKKTTMIHTERYSLLRAVGVASSAGITLFVCIGGCIYLGYLFDEYVGGSPWGLLVGGIIGGFGGLYTLYKQVVSK